MYQQSQRRAQAGQFPPSKPVWSAGWTAHVPLCVWESGRATLLKLRAVPWPVRERDEDSHHHHQHCKPRPLVLLFAVEVGGQLQRSMHDLVAPEVKLCRLQKLESFLHGEFCERDHLWLYSLMLVIVFYNIDNWYIIENRTISWRSTWRRGSVVKAHLHCKRQPKPRKITGFLNENVVKN